MTRHPRNYGVPRNRQHKRHRGNSPQVIYVQEAPKKKSPKLAIYLVMVLIAAALLGTAYANRKAIWMEFTPILNAMGSFALMIGVFGFICGIFGGSSKVQTKSAMVIIAGAVLVGLAKTQWL
jgi:hypothetical protein